VGRKFSTGFVAFVPAVTPGGGVWAAGVDQGSRRSSIFVTAIAARVLHNFPEREPPRRVHTGYWSVAPRNDSVAKSRRVRAHPTRYEFPTDTGEKRFPVEQVSGFVAVSLM